MDIQIVTAFYSFNPFLKTFNHKPEPQSRRSEAEVTAAVLVGTPIYGISTVLGFHP